MYIMIDSSDRDKVRLSLFDETTKNDIELEASNRELLKEIDGFFTEQNSTKDDIAGMVVVVGEGSFTSTRLATTIANTFAYVRRIPLLPVSKVQAADPQILISELLAQPAGQYISATYSAAPSIGGK